MSSAAPPLHTPLHALHASLGARFVPFAGYAMPVQYPTGILAEHRHCRSAAALFDVSHMGQIRLSGADAAAALETLVPVDVCDLPLGRQRYALFTDANGGVLDDLMITRRAHDLLLVVNAGRKADDLRHLQQHLGVRCGVDLLADQALLALQGPQAAAALTALDARAAALPFMHATTLSLGGIEAFVSRSGYTGEDGYEISVPGHQAEDLARRLLALPGVRPAGLGARDTLRLEAGMCLYGQDIDPQRTPVEAALTWAIQKVRRPGGARAGGYPGAARIAAQLADGPAQRRVGLLGLERVPVREGAALFQGEADAAPVGQVTSGTLSPTLNQPVAMGYVATALAQAGQRLWAEVRSRRVPLQVAALPFVPHRYFRG